VYQSITEARQTEAHLGITKVRFTMKRHARGVQPTRVNCSSAKSLDGCCNVDDDDNDMTINGGEKRKKWDSNRLGYSGRDAADDILFRVIIMAC
jgi:hypothetical protein